MYWCSSSPKNFILLYNICIGYTFFYRYADCWICNTWCKDTKKKIKEAIIFSLLIGIPSTLIFIFIPDVPLKLVYNTNLGLEYIKVTAPFFLLHYIQAPLTSSLNGMGYSKEAMKGTLYGGIIKLLSLTILSYLKIGLWSLIISSILNILTVTIHHIYYINKYLKSTNYS